MVMSKKIGIILIFFALLLYLQYRFFYKVTNQYLPGTFQIFNSNRTNSFFQIVNSSCSPFLSKTDQYFANINGIKYPRIIPHFLNKSIDFECLNKNSPKKKMILMWTKYFGMTVNYNFGINEEPDEVSKKEFPNTYFLGGYCPVHNCEVTYNRDRLNEADLVFTHMREGNLERDKLPKTRPEHQRWVFMLFESPMHSPDFSSFNGFYNLTTTHRESGDFPGYSAFANGMVWERNEKFDVNFDFLSEKTHEATAIISNCGDNSGRLKYIKELQKYMKVDIFGKCGLKCSERFVNIPTRYVLEVRVFEMTIVVEIESFTYKSLFLGRVRKIFLENLSTLTKNISCFFTSLSCSHCVHAF